MFERARVAASRFAAAAASALDRARAPQRAPKRLELGTSRAQGLAHAALSPGGGGTAATRQASTAGGARERCATSRAASQQRRARRQTRNRPTELTISAVSASLTSTVVPCASATEPRAQHCDGCWYQTRPDMTASAQQKDNPEGGHKLGLGARGRRRERAGTAATRARRGEDPMLGRRGAQTPPGGRRGGRSWWRQQRRIGKQASPATPQRGTRPPRPRHTQQADAYTSYVCLAGGNGHREAAQGASGARLQCRSCAAPPNGPELLARAPPRHRASSPPRCTAHTAADGGAARALGPNPRRAAKPGSRLARPTRRVRAIGQNAFARRR